MEALYRQSLPFEHDRQMLRDANAKQAREEREMNFDINDRALESVQVFAVPLNSPQQLSEYLDSIKRTTHEL